MWLRSDTGLGRIYVGRERRKQHMPNQDGKEIARGVLAKMAEFKKSCEGLNEELSLRAPEGR